MLIDNLKRALNEGLAAHSSSGQISASLTSSSLNSAQAGAGTLAEAALVCYLDICQAALLLPQEKISASQHDKDSLALQTFASDVVEEIHVISFSLYRRSRRLMFGCLMQSFLLNPPFYKEEKDLDVALYSDALQVLFRHNPESALRDFFGPCLEPERSDAVIMTVFRTSLCLTQEFKR